MPNDKAETIRKTFNEAVTEIRMYEQNLKEVVPRAPSEESGRSVELTTSTYSETMAELERLQLIRRLASKGRKRV
ncbi:Uncharacterised protein [uncultured archaeon]|nr:Uncharacterised protein [uncultured archaeon]